jgi:hypothetical protein
MQAVAGTRSVAVRHTAVAATSFVGAWRSALWVVGGGRPGRGHFRYRMRTDVETRDGSWRTIECTRRSLGMHSGDCEAIGTSRKEKYPSRSAQARQDGIDGIGTKLQSTRRIRAHAIGLAWRPLHAPALETLALAAAHQGVAGAGRVSISFPCSAVQCCAVTSTLFVVCRHGQPALKGPELHTATSPTCGHRHARHMHSLSNLLILIPCGREAN